MEELNLRHFAHIGDALWELEVRKKVVYMTKNANMLHKLSVSFVNAEFQTNLLEKIEDSLTEIEKDITRRARNIPTSVKRRNNQALHRHATAFEVLLGYLYYNDKERYQKILRDFLFYVTADSEMLH